MFLKIVIDHLVLVAVKKTRRRPGTGAARPARSRGGGAVAGIVIR